MQAQAAAPDHEASAGGYLGRGQLHRSAYSYDEGFEEKLDLQFIYLFIYCAWITD